MTKQIVPSTAPVGSITGAVAAGAGWQFTSVMNTAGVTTPIAIQTTTANGTGTVNYPLDYVGGTTTGSVTVTEAQQAGFTLVTGRWSERRLSEPRPRAPRSRSDDEHRRSGSR